MAFLLAPTVIGPVSECSSSIEVQGQLIGSTVTLYAGTRVIGSAVATWPRQTIALSPTAALKPDEFITATQSDSSGVSLHSGEPFVIVGRRWKVVPGVTFATPLYGCTDVVWVSGCLPGAEVEVELAGATLGKGTAVAGDARFGFKQHLNAGDILTARQTACGVAGPVSGALTADSLPRILPPPLVEAPLIECGITVTVSGVLPGATVTLERSRGTKLTAIFDAPSLYFQLAQPLVLGETLFAHQEFPQCRAASAPSPTVTVLPRTSVPAPVLIGQLCSNAGSAEATDLIPGALVMLFASGKEVGAFQAPSASFVFQFPIQSTGSKLTLKQQMCDHWSDSSNAITLTNFKDPPLTPVIEEPLFRCGAAVRVNNLRPIGGWLQLSSVPNDTILGEVFITAAEMDVPVSPLLLAGDAIVALVRGCGNGPVSKKAIVEVGTVDLRPPVVITAVSKARVVTLAQVVPGAWVDLYLNGIWNVSAPFGGATATLNTSKDLQVGDQLLLRQRLCTVSQFGTYTVVAPPKAAFTAIPTTGPAPLSVTHHNSSTGAITKYTWQFEAAPPLVTTTLTSPVHVYSTPGTHGAVLTVEGPGGKNSAAADIIVEPLGYDEFVIHNCNANSIPGTAIHRAIHIYFRLAGGADPWSPIFDSPLDAEYSTSGFCPAPGSRGAHLSLDDGKTYEVVCTDPYLPACNGDPNNLACRRSKVFTVRGKKGGGAMTVIVN